MNIRELQARRANITTEMRSILSAPATDGDLSPEQETRFDTLKTELEGVEQRLARQATLDEAERRMQGQTITGTGDDRFDSELRSFSLVRAIAGAAGIPGVDAGRERELSAEVARRAGRPFAGMAIPMSVFHQPVENRGMIAANDPAGGYLVGTTDGGQFIDLFRARLAVRSLGATVLSGLSGNLEIPKMTGSSTAAWIGEQGALSVTDPSFGAVNMTPRHVGVLTELSRNMLIQPSRDVEALVRRDFAALLAGAVDAAAINGSGVGAEPLGILGTAGIANVAMGDNGATLTPDACRDLIGLIDAANADVDSLAFLSNSKVKTQASKIKDADGNYLGLDTVFANQQFAFSNNVPANLTKGTAVGTCSPVIYGNWSDLLLGMWSEIDLLTNPYEAGAYSRGGVQVRGLLSMDVAVRHAESFAAIKDVVTG